MLKIKIIFALILGFQTLGLSQWEEKSISTNLTLSCVDFVNDELGFVTGGNTIFKTENGASDWTINYTASNMAFYEDIFVIDYNNIIAVGNDFASNQSIITKTSNGGTTWTEVAISNSSILKSVYFTSATIGYCSGGGGVILKTVDGGNNWQELSSGTGLNLQSIHFVNDLVGIAVGGFPGSAIILKTQDGGATWNQIISPSNNYLQSVFFSNQETAYVVGWNGEIIKTTNCGDTWTSQNSVEMTGNLEVLFTNNNTGYIVGGNVNETLLQKTTNGGDTWIDVSPQVQEGLVSIQFPSLDVGYAVGSNGTVMKTESGGLAVSINDFKLSDEFNVFPNPTTGIVNVQSENNSQIESLRVYDSNGRIVKEVNPNSVTPEIDLSNLESNIYYLEIHANDVKSIRKVIIE